MESEAKGEGGGEGSGGSTPSPRAGAPLSKSLASDVDEAQAVALLSSLQETSPALYGDFNSEDVRMLASYMSILRLDEGDRLIERGENSSFFAIVLEGALEVNLVTLQLGLKAGEMLGEMSFFERGGTRTADVSCVRAGYVAVMEFDDLDRLRELDAYSELYYKFAFVLAKSTVAVMKRINKRAEQRVKELTGGKEADPALSATNSKQRRVDNNKREVFLQSRLTKQAKDIDRERARAEQKHRLAEHLIQTQKHVVRNRETRIKKLEAEALERDIEIAGLRKFEAEARAQMDKDAEFNRFACAEKVQHLATIKEREADAAALREELASARAEAAAALAESEQRRAAQEAEAVERLRTERSSAAIERERLEAEAAKLREALQAVMARKDSAVRRVDTYRSTLAGLETLEVHEHDEPVVVPEGTAASSPAASSTGAPDAAGGGGAGAGAEAGGAAADAAAAAAASAAAAGAVGQAADVPASAKESNTLAVPPASAAPRPLTPDHISDRQLRKHAGVVVQLKAELKRKTVLVEQMELQIANHNAKANNSGLEARRVREELAEKSDLVRDLEAALAASRARIRDLVRDKEQYAELLRAVSVYQFVRRFRVRKQLKGVQDTLLRLSAGLEKELDGDELPPGMTAAAPPKLIADEPQKGPVTWDQLVGMRKRLAQEHHEIDCIVVETGRIHGMMSDLVGRKDGWRKTCNLMFNSSIEAKARAMAADAALGREAAETFRLRGELDDARKRLERVEAEAAVEVPPRPVTPRRARAASVRGGEEKVAAAPAPEPAPEPESAPAPAPAPEPVPAHVVTAVVPPVTLRDNDAQQQDEGKASPPPPPPPPVQRPVSARARPVSRERKKRARRPATASRGRAGRMQQRASAAARRQPRARSAARSRWAPRAPWDSRTWACSERAARPELITDALLPERAPVSSPRRRGRARSRSRSSALPRP